MNAKLAAEKLIADALQLPLAERAAIVDALLGSLPLADLDHGADEPAAAVEAAWRDEIARRLEEIDSGRTQALPSEEAWRIINGDARSQL